MEQNSTNIDFSEELRKLAGTHLGKAGDGSLVKPYVTPDKHDSTLLVPLPRSLNRQKSGINSSFCGYEIWHAYEMSFLLTNGMPCTGVLRTRFEHSTLNMVESKSFKLYLNSFDLERFNNSDEVVSIIKKDLTEAAGGEVEVFFHEANNCEFLPIRGNIDFYQNVDSFDHITINGYREDPNLLDVAVSEGEGTQFVYFHTANLRSNCEITNQKDTGNCYIMIKGEQVPTLEGLTKYIISFRDSQHFHENVTEIIYQTLQEKYNPTHLLVANIYNRRGGLDIHSVRASSPRVLDNEMRSYGKVSLLFKKESQQ